MIITGDDLAAVGREGSPGGSSVGVGGDREGREERPASAQQPTGEPRDATRRRTLLDGSRPLR